MTKEMNFNKIKNLIQQALNVLAKKAFWFFLFLIIFYFILGSILIYQYSILAQRTEILSAEKEQNVFEENSYQKISEHWKTNKIEFDKINQKIYPDPFIEKTRQEFGGQEQEQAQILSIEDKEDLSSDLSSIASEEAKEESTATVFFGKMDTLFDYYISKGMGFLSINERAKIWEQEGLGETEEYHGFYHQNTKLLEQLTK